MADRDDDPRTNRQIARSKQKRAGDRSADVAATLMKLSDAEVKRLEIDDELRDELDRARAITSHVARRRAERTLAGALRGIDIGAVEAAVEKVKEHGVDVRQFHEAEQWRAKLIDEGMEAAAGFPAAIDDELPRLVDAARRERATGKPPGAARALFRHITALLKSKPD
jgi:ribosome-associated protein